MDVTGSGFGNSWSADRLFAGPGETRERLRRTDWAATPLGPVETWSVELRAAVRTVLPSEVPMLLWWGPELVQIFNDSYTRVLGAKYPAAIGEPGAQCWAEIWDEVGPLAEQVMSGGAATYTENQPLYLLRHGYLEETYWTFSYSPVQDEDGNVAGVFVATTDVTATVLGERRLETLRQLGTVSTAGGDDPLVDACRAVVRVLGDSGRDVPLAAIYLRREVVGGSGDDAAEDLVLVGAVGVDDDGEFRPARIPATDVTRHRGRAPGELEPAATKAVTEVRLCPLIVTGHAEPVGVLVLGISPYRAFDDAYRGFAELVTAKVSTLISDALAYEFERDRAAALAELDAAKTRFFENVSHEFRTPLTLLLGPLEALRERTGDESPADQRDAIAAAYRAAVRLQQLVDDLLDLSKAEAGQLLPRAEPTDVGRLTADCVSMFDSAAVQAGLALRADIDEGSGPVELDREMWVRIVLNLVSNAVKYTRSGSVSVALRQDTGRLVLSVTDTGVGIPAEEQERVFHRFYRVEARGSGSGGVGIGLSLVADFAAALGGSVDLDSAPGRGSTFTVRIPRIPAPDGVTPRATDRPVGAVTPFGDVDQREPSAEVAVSNERGADRRRILLVEDHPDLRAYLTRLLQEQGWDVDPVADAESALKHVAARPPHLVLSDIMLPGRDGIDFLRELRSEQSTARLPVVLLTARAGTESTVDGLNHGADDYIVKPFQPNELVARVRVHLEMSWLRETLITDSELESKQLRTALDTRTTLSQAVGLTMAAFQCDADTAFDKLSSYSQNRNVKLREIAAEVVANFAAGTDRK
ncbi:response regulator [Rhodococcus sp. NPDC127530]|uniref:response regulator n=1 Tax=unclassified Rhodococcus (in: high G+C Gram-positive bacteria) TaxID=192944 RepID=UPI00364340C0